MASPYLTTAQVAEYFCVSNRTVQQWVRRKRIRPLQAGLTYLFTAAEVERFIERRRANGTMATGEAPRLIGSGRPKRQPAAGAAPTPTTPPKAAGANQDTPSPIRTVDFCCPTCGQTLPTEKP